MRGHLFAGRYKALVVDESDNFYLRTVYDYVHLNPVRARLTPDQLPLEEYPWRSYPVYLSAPRKRPQCWRVDRLLGEHGIRRDGSRGRREFSRRMEVRRREQEDEETLKGIRRGWRFGAEDFLERLDDRMAVARSDQHSPDQFRDQQRLSALAVLKRELESERMKASELLGMRKGDPIKVRIAAAL